MRPTHHLVPNVRFRKTKSTVRVKSRKSDHKTYFNLKIVKINKFHTGRRTICMFRKIEQACSILKEVYICCSKIVDPVSLSKGRCAQSVSIKNRYFVICFYCCETDRMIFEGNIICLTFSQLQQNEERTMILQRLWPCGGRRPQSDLAGGAKNYGPFLITKL